MLAISSAHAAGLVKNGGFEQNTGTGQLGHNTSATGWNTTGYNFLFDGDTADRAGARGFYGYLALWGPSSPRGGAANGFKASPTGGYFLAADGAFGVEPVTQMIDGLVAGRTYTLGFDWAASQQFGYSGSQTEQWKVSLGSETHATDVYSNVSHGFSGWKHEQMRFTATGPSELLSFLAVGTPNGVPPFSLLDGVTLSTPEPATWAMMIAGFGMVGAAMRRSSRRHLALVAA